MKLPATLRRPDWLAEVQHLLLVVLALVTAAGVVGGVVGLTGAAIDVPLSVRTALGAGAVTVDGLPLDVGPLSLVSVRVEHPDGGQVALGLLTHAPTWLLACLMLGLLWRLVREARRTEPFTDHVARRLRRLGWLLAVGGPLAEVVQFLAAFSLAGTLPPGHPEATLTLAPMVTWLLLGVGMLAISEVVRRGRELRTELDGVV